MDRRLKLHEHLVALCPNVYFQPGANVTLKYPCIIYSRYDDSTLRANNKLYHREVGYQLTVIYREADNGLADEIMFTVPNTSWMSSFISENLHHELLLSFN